MVAGTQQLWMSGAPVRYQQPMQRCEGEFIIEQFDLIPPQLPRPEDFFTKIGLIEVETVRVEGTTDSLHRLPAHARGPKCPNVIELQLPLPRFAKLGGLYTLKPDRHQFQEDQLIILGASQFPAFAQGFPAVCGQVIETVRQIPLEYLIDISVKTGVGMHQDVAAETGIAQ